MTSGTALSPALADAGNAIMSCPHSRIASVSRQTLDTSSSPEEVQIARAGGSAISSDSPLGESLHFQPVIKLINPVVAGRTLFFYAEAMTARTENVSFRFVARRS